MVVIVLSTWIRNGILRMRCKAESQKNMVLIHSAGKDFQMGGDGSVTPHTVRFAYDFRIGRYEVTQGEYRQAVGENPSYFNCSDNLPVEMVTWYDAVLYCNARSKIEGYDTVYCFKVSGKTETGEKELSNVENHYEKKGFRLPTEAEWEFACRSELKSDCNLGKDTQNIGDYCWYFDNSLGKTHKGGLKKPNMFGLYDMLGNVGEWCGDWFNIDNFGPYKEKGVAENPQGPKNGFGRVLRGGSGSNFARNCRCACRFGITPDFRDGNVGFRVVLVP